MLFLRQDVNFKQLSKDMEGFSGADVAEVCRRAIGLVISETVELMVIFTRTLVVFRVK